MKNTLNNIVWVIFFSWIVFYGTVSAATNCHDRKVSLCYETSQLGSNTGTAVSARTDRACASPDNGDLCCQNRPCTPNLEFLLPHQNLNAQNQSILFAVNRTEPPVGKPVSGSVFKHHSVIQTVSIYTITQSFLC